MKRYTIEDNARLFQAYRTKNDHIIEEYYHGLKCEFIKNISSRYSCIPAEDINDIYNESFIELGEQIISGKLTENILTVPVGGYLYGIGKNIAHSYVKPQEFIYIEEMNDENMVSDIVDIYTHDSSLTKEDCELIEEYVSKLAEPCSSLLKMFYYDDYTMFGIAKLKKYKSEDVAKSTKNKCMTRLKELIKKGLYGKFDYNRKN